VAIVPLCRFAAKKQLPQKAQKHKGSHLSKIGCVLGDSSGPKKVTCIGAT